MIGSVDVVVKSDYAMEDTLNDKIILWAVIYKSWLPKTKIFVELNFEQKFEG